MRLILRLMRKLSEIQTLGTIALCCAMLAAESLAYALERAPSSDWLWYLNLKWFGMFQDSHYALERVLGGNCEQISLIAFPLVTFAFLGLAYNRSLLLAISSNLSFVYIVLVFITSSGARSSVQASLVALPAGPANSGAAVIVLLAALALPSVVVSHFAYIEKIRARLR